MTITQLIENELRRDLKDVTRQSVKLPKEKDSIKYNLAFDILKEREEASNEIAEIALKKPENFNWIRLHMSMAHACSTTNRWKEIMKNLKVIVELKENTYN